MSIRNLSLALSCLTLAWIALPAHSQTQTIPRGPNPGAFLCPSACPGGDLCSVCRTSPAAPWITCAEYYGAPANDWDRDGIANASDNCSCAANANQANCDGDSWGDACDWTDNSWAKISTSLNACHIDDDDHVVYDTMEIYGQDTYRSACTGATCIKKVLWIAFDCFPNASVSCCNNHWGSSTDCNRPPVDACGYPRCSF